MNQMAFLLIIAGVLLNAGAQLLLKAGVAPLGPISVDLQNLLPTTLHVLGRWPIVAGLGCYVVSVGIWILALSRVDVSVAYPMLSLGYVVNALAARWLFGESLDTMHWAGMLLILGGVLLMARA